MATAALTFVAILPPVTARADLATPRPTGGTDESSVAPSHREAVLGHSWQRSKDRAWTTSSDAAGFHLLIADKRNGYAWRTAASLSEPGFDTDMWIGNACVTGSGKRAVVAYAPRTFTNKADLMARGAFTAIVDLDTGAVTKLNRQASLAYFSPGCGRGETAVFTQANGDTKNATRLIQVDTVTRKLAAPIELKGEVTSAVPVRSSIVAADGPRLVKIDRSGRRTVLASTSQVPLLLKPDADGGLVYMDRPAQPGNAQGQNQGAIERITAQDIARGDAKMTKPTQLATGPLTKMDLTASADGQVFITGDTRASGPLPRTVKQRSDAPAESLASSEGEALVTATGWADRKDPRLAASPGAVRSTRITLKPTNTGKLLHFQVTPDQQGIGQKVNGAARSPSLPPLAPAKNPSPSRKSVRGKAKALNPATSSSPVDDGRTCSIPRNDPAQQTMQPKPRQVEWAVDQAITGNLNSLISRPANWKNEGMDAYQPQTLFPLHGLNGGGRIPAQVMLGITAQESNMWQASGHVVPGETGNALIGNYYGTPYTSDGQQTDPWAIDWSKADCGYGITQVTDGMRKHGYEKPGETPLSTLQQQAVALDYTANIAAGVNILADKWNQTRADGLVIDNGGPQYPENWFFALWAYNSGYHPKSEAADNGGAWGVGWTNNPANPLWKANRLPFLENASGGDDYSDAAHPQDWPYPEKVLGWAARPLQALESPGTMVVGFRPAWWTTNAARTAVKPPIGLFCTTANQCDPSKISTGATNDPGMGPCTRTDLKCWWNLPTSWKSCATGLCGNEILRFDSTYAEQADGTAYPPNCSTTGLPANALIVDDVPDDTPIHRPGCTIPKASSGTFSFDYGSDSAKIDLHQLGSGYDGHFWFAHGRDASSQYDRLRVTGTWQLNTELSKPTGKVLVHIPDHGAQTTAASYEIDTARGTRTVTISQVTDGTNHWVDLGTFGFQGVKPAVHLSNQLIGGQGDHDVAFDAVAIVPADFIGAAPVIHLPDPDPTAPDPDVQDSPQAAPSGLGPAVGFRAALTKSCQASKTDPHKQYCFTFNATAQKQIKRNPAIPRSALTDDQECGTNLTSFTRYFSCESMSPMTYSVVTDGTEEILATFVGQWTITLNKSDPGFQLKFQMRPITIAAKAESVTFHFDYQCTGACTLQGSPQYDGVFTWAGLVDTHAAAVTYNYKWSNSASSTAQHDNLVIGSPQTYFTSLDGGESDKHPWSTNALGLRCDNDATTNYSFEGCAFSKFIPTYTVNSKKYPAAAAMYWELMNKLSSHPGSAKSGTTPLHRIADPSVSSRNRDYVCDKTFIPHPDANKGNLAPNESTSCDEYPFAATQESAGFKQISGLACVQFYATKVTGSWELLLDPGYGTPVTWAELCGRGAIPQNQNTSAGGGVGGIVSKNRLRDGDPYWLETPGFDNQCDPNAAECTISIP